MKRLSPALAELLRECRIQLSYLDVNKKRRRATLEAIFALLRGLGIAINRPEQAGAIVQQLRRRRFGRGIEPVLVAWNGRFEAIDVTVPAASTGLLQYELDASGQRSGKSMALDSLQPVCRPELAELGYVQYKLPIHHQLPMGYHALQISVGAQTYESVVISAPQYAYNHSEFSEFEGVRQAGAGRQERAWGTFLPLYALRHAGDWGAGDLTALGRLADWTGRLGGSAVGTLPLLAASLDEPFEQSPYRPLSRQFWNAFYIDVEAVPELQSCHGCREIIDAVDLQSQLRALRLAELVDYRKTMLLKRRALMLLASRFFAIKPTDRFVAYDRFRLENPQVERYARFCAAQDRQRSSWLEWPQSMKQEVSDEDFDLSDYRYHLYAQWIAAEQLASVKQKAAATGCGLYLDLPVGVDPGGFDVWQNKDLFVEGASIGAPPDAFFTKGQDWGLPPLHPERIRETAYAHLRQVLATNMRFARYLRIDHAMGWHRLYWIAPGLRADEGAYVTYAADEIYAVASVESHRHRCTILAENLGTVSPAVGKALDQHGVGCMWVAPYELEPSRRQGLKDPPPLSVASLNTHDMPLAAAWWRGEDVADRMDLGLLDAQEAEIERADRAKAVDILREWLRSCGYSPIVGVGDPSDIPPINDLLRALAASRAQLVLITLEDLWLETRPQNVPGTLFERPNWQRKARYALEEFMDMPDVINTLSQVNELRHRSRSSS